ncbi:MAG: hypothetical protein L3J35_13155 [Bacteroidales bacterium]|nr:hypothetical protein [Bacteroidales bacterium]
MEPLKKLYNKYGFQINSIKYIEAGDTYIAVMLNSGLIGLSANLMNIKTLNVDELVNIDFNNYKHRNVLNAYYNAMLNNTEENFINIDIFDFINFSEYSKIVMVGFSEPMYRKLKLHNIRLTVFDKSISSKDNSIITNIKEQKKHLQNADIVILTSTSVMNNTFCNIIEYTDNDCDIFMFGASTLMNKFMFKYPKIKGLFGTVFDTGNKQILEIIKEGHGHRYLKKHGKKVALIRH